MANLVGRSARLVACVARLIHFPWTNRRAAKALVEYTAHLERHCDRCKCGYPGANRVETGSRGDGCHQRAPKLRRCRKTRGLLSSLPSSVHIAEASKDRRRVCGQQVRCCAVDRSCSRLPRMCIRCRQAGCFQLAVDDRSRSVCFASFR
jgi:hypothetical protein